MGHRTRRRLRRGTGWLLVWTVLLAVPPLALAGSRAGYDIGTPRQHTSATPVRDTKITECQTQEQAMSSTLKVILSRVHAAQETHDPAQMRATLDAVEQPLAAMQGHMAMCTK